MTTQSSDVDARVSKDLYAKVGKVVWGSAFVVIVALAGWAFDTNARMAKGEQRMEATEKINDRIQAALERIESKLDAHMVQK